MPDLSGKRAVVTGAGRGIGRAIAQTLAQHGVDVALVARSRSQLEQVAEAVRRLGPQALVVPIDIAQEDQVQHLRDTVLGTFGGVDILVNNAAAFGGGPVATMRTEEWDRVLNTNLRGVFLVTRAFLPSMIEQSAGTIVMISSTSGKRGDPGAAAYCASKFGLMGLAASLTHEVRQHNIRVMTICPSAVDTRPVSGDQLPQGGKGSRLHADDIAQTVLYAVQLPPRALLHEVEMWGTNP